MEMPAVIRRRTRLSPEARREQLSLCAIEVFANRGLARAGHAEIAQLAQVSVATIFNYFSTRADLVNMVLQQVDDFFRQMVTVHFGAPGDDADSAPQPFNCEQAIHCYLSDFVDAALDNPHYCYIWLEWSSAMQEDTWPAYLNLLEHNIAQITARLQPDIDSGAINSALTATELARSLCNQGYMILQLSNQPQSIARDEIVRLVSNYTQGLLQSH